MVPGLSISSVKETNSKYAIMFSFEGDSVKADLPKSCAPGCHNEVADNTINTAMSTLYFIVNGKTGTIILPDEFKLKNVDVSVSTGAVNVFADASEKIEIQTTSGNIRVGDISAGTLELSVSTGKVTVSGVTCKGDISVGVTTGNAYLTDIACKSVISSGSTGGILLNNVVAAEKFSIKRSTGNIKFDGCDAAEIFAETSTGDVKGRLLTDKVYITKTSVGRIDVPNTTTGGRCEIKTDTGDIEIKTD